jgi:hypothetical protein
LLRTLPPSGSFAVSLETPKVCYWTEVDEKMGTKEKEQIVGGNLFSSSSYKQVGV